MEYVKPVPVAATDIVFVFLFWTESLLGGWLCCSDCWIAALR
jgi:hypothetical protein